MEVIPPNPRYCSFERPITKVALVGGTHGNELHGQFLVREMHELTAFLQETYNSLYIEALLANPKAIEATGTGYGRRYVEKDLNRCFYKTDLEIDSTDKGTYEDFRARELDAVLGPKNSPNPAFDFIVDIHSTTSNTGVLILCHPQDTFTIGLAHQLQKKHPSISIMLWSDSDVPLLPSISRSGMTLEVGCIPHSTAVSSLYRLTKTVIFDLLEIIQIHNTNFKFLSFYKPTTIDVFERYCTIGYPRDVDGRMLGFIHEDIQGLLELQPTSYIDDNTKLFELFSGDCLDLKSGLQQSTLQFSSSSGAFDSLLSTKFKLYPNFINEAAYYEKDIAFNLCVKKTIETKEFSSHY